MRSAATRSGTRTRIDFRPSKRTPAVSASRGTTSSPSLAHRPSKRPRIASATKWHRSLRQKLSSEIRTRALRAWCGRATSQCSSARATAIATTKRRSIAAAFRLTSTKVSGSSKRTKFRTRLRCCVFSRSPRRTFAPSRCFARASSACPTPPSWRLARSTRRR